MFSKKVLEKCNKEELNAKLLETYEKIQEKNYIIAKLEKDLVNYEMKKLTVGHQKATTVLILHWQFIYPDLPGN